MIKYRSPKPTKPILKSQQQTMYTCPSESQYHKTMSKFFRKPDTIRLQEKKKKSVQNDTSIMCYLTPKNCEENNKLLKEKMFKNCKSEININSFLGNSPFSSGKDLQTQKSNIFETIMLKSPTNSIETSLCQERKPKYFSSKNMLQKNGVKSKRSSKIIISEPQQQQSASFLQVESRIRPSLSRDLNKSIHDKSNRQLRKLKTRCQNYSTEMEQKNYEIKRLKERNQKLQVDILELKRKCNTVDQAKKKIQILQKQLRRVNLQKQKEEKTVKQLEKEVSRQQQQLKNRQEELLYLQQNIKKLQQIIKDYENTSRQLHQSQKLTFKNSKRGNSFCVCDNTEYMHRPILENEEKGETEIIQNLRNELKYCQVQISMLKRVKIDVNKQNQEFLRLQRQNRILKKHIFDLKTQSADKNIKQKNKQSENGQSLRKNFQISGQNSRKKQLAKVDKISDNGSSDTFSLNLSLSPQNR